MRMILPQTKYSDRIGLALSSAQADGGDEFRQQTREEEKLKQIN